MRNYLNKPIANLAAELVAGVLRLKRGYVDATEALSQIITTDGRYPYEFVVYRITGYRGSRTLPAGDAMDGGVLSSDLATLILDLCDSFPLHCDVYSEPLHSIESLARRFNVSTKTIQRWRRDGLIARRVIFPDGKRRVGFLESSVNWFVNDRKSKIARSTKFTQLTAAERADIIVRSRRMARFTQCSLSEVSRRLAARMNRAVETVRYTIRKHDLENPSDAIFPHLAAPLDDKDKSIIHRCYIQNVPVTSLAERFGRTRGSIYRIINEMQARQLISQPITYMHNPQFDLPNADDLILTSVRKLASSAVAKTKGPTDMPAYLRALYRVPLLTREQEGDLFRRMNYLKYKADKARRKIDLNRARASKLKAIEQLLLDASVVKNRIIRSNLRLVVSIAKKHMGGAQTLFELISDGNVSLMRAVEKFDYARGHRFSTYASWAIMRNFARSVPKERYQLDRFATGYDEVLDIAASLRTYNPNELNIPELRESIDAMLSQLSTRERTILVDHYGLDREGRTRTLDELGKRLGVSKERVRQIEIQALKKLRKIMHPRQADFMLD